MNKRALAFAFGSLTLAAAVAIHGAPRPPAVAASVLQAKVSPAVTEPSRAVPVVAQPNVPAASSSEVGKPVQYSQISTIPDKSFYLYFFSPS